jgi:hypothetical protein
MKDRTKRFYNNINAKKLKSLEELVTAIAAMHNIIRAGGGGNTNLTVPCFRAHFPSIDTFPTFPDFSINPAESSPFFHLFQKDSS